MVTTVADTLFHRLIDAFPADQAYGSTDFSRDAMPMPMRHYLEQRLSLRLKDAVPPEDDWIDADNEDVRGASVTYRNAIFHHMRIPSSAWHSELGSACRTVVSYLIRPAPTLTDLIFGNGREDATMEEISEQFRLVPAYSYFEEVVGGYFAQRNLDRIDRERFSGLARRIDHQMVRDFDADEWVELLQPLMELIGQIPEFSRGLPVDVFKVFLQEKGADHLVARAEARFDPASAGFIRRENLREFFELPLEKTTTDREAAAASPARSSARVEEPRGGSHVPLWKQFESGLGPSSQTRGSSEVSNRGDSAPARTVEAEPLWKQFHGSARPSAGPDSAVRRDSSPRGDTSPRDEVSPREHVSRRDEPASPNESSSSAGKPSRSPRSLAEPTGAGSQDVLSDLEHSVLGQRGRRNRDLFLRHLFSESSEAYEDTLRKLNAADNWSEASQIIAREVFLKHQVNIYSDPAVAFTDAAEAKFRS